MYKFIKILFAFLIFTLIAVNIVLFVKGMSLSSGISDLENKISMVNKENSQFEQKIYKIQSHTRIASLASELSFGRYNDPIFVKDVKYALK